MSDLTLTADEIKHIRESFDNARVHDNLLCFYGHSYVLHYHTMSDEGAAALRKLLGANHE